MSWPDQSEIFSDRYDDSSGLGLRFRICACDGTRMGLMPANEGPSEYARIWYRYSDSDNLY